MKNPEELKQQLIMLFPSFVNEYNDDSEDDEFEIGYKSPLTHHRVWMDFAPVAYEYLSHASKKSLVKFGSLINAEVAAGTNNENAVSTCFLEHASQISVKKIIKPLLSSDSKKELR